MHTTNISVVPAASPRTLRDARTACVVWAGRACDEEAPLAHAFIYQNDIKWPGSLTHDRTQSLRHVMLGYVYIIIRRSSLSLSAVVATHKEATNLLRALCAACPDTAREACGDTSRVTRRVGLPCAAAAGGGGLLDHRVGVGGGGLENGEADAGAEDAEDEQEGRDRRQLVPGE